MDEIKHVVALSGGKDSTALALRLAEVEPRDYEYICTPTGNEPPEVDEHLARLETILGKKIVRIMPYGDGDGLHAVIRDQGMIPNFRARFCTRILKIEPMIAWMKANTPCVQYVGLRADEPEREGLYGSIDGVSTRHPLREWGWDEAQIWSYLDEKGIKIPERTDCALCFYQKLIEWKRLWMFNREAFDKGVAIEEEMGHTFRSPSRDTWPASLKELGEAFASGRKVRGEDRFNKRELSDCDRQDLCRVCSL